MGSAVRWGIAFCLTMACGCEQETQSGGNEAAAPSGNGQVQDLGGIVVMVPEEWGVEAPSSQMRKAQYRLPSPTDGVNDARLVVFHFGPGMAGSAQANLERWYGQITQPDGRSSAEVATVEEREINGMKVTLMDVTGTYMESKGPMMQPGAAQADSRMLAAVIESAGGAYYFKVTGPATTVAHWKLSYDQFVDNVRQK